MNQTPPAGLIAFVLGFPIAIMFGISRLGWNELAARYPLSGAAPKALTVFGYGSLRGWIGYNGGLIVSADESGLYLATLPFLMAWCHPPVFIPWSQIVSAVPLGFWSRNYFGLELRGAPELKLALNARTFALVRPFAEKAGVPVAAR